MKELVFIVTTKKLTRKWLCISNPLWKYCLNRVVFVSPGGDVAVISLYQSVTNLTFLNALWFKTGTGDDQRYIPINVLALMLLVSCNACRMWLRKQFFTYWKVDNVPNRQTDKIDELTNLIDFRNFSHSL